MERRKTVFLEPLWKLRRELRWLLEDPPEGYEFVCRGSLSETFAEGMSRLNLAYTAVNSAGRVFPVHLAKAWAGRFRRPPDGSTLTYAVSHPVFRREPWVMDMRAEQPHVMAGGERPFDWLRGRLRRLFASPHCRAVVYEVEAGKRAFLQRLIAPDLEPKVKVVPSGVPERRFTKSYDDEKIRLLFVNSANINAAWNFALKGGNLLLKAFALLRERYPNLELFVRSDMPPRLKRSLHGVPGLTLRDAPLPWDDLEREFERADIFVMPTYVTPSIVFLDAMSYELPVVTTDVWANRELVREGETGLLFPNTLASRYTDGFVVHFDAPAFRKALDTVDPAMLHALVDRLSLLIEQPELRRRLGRRGRELTARERSLAAQKLRLKAVLDEALARCEQERAPG